MLPKTNVRIVTLPNYEGLPLPSYATEQSAGVDLLAAIDKDTVLPAGCRMLVPCGIIIALPPGYEAQVRPRSGLAVNYGLTLLNSPGTIDADYRGEVKACLLNTDKNDFVISRGMRIAQLVVAPVTRVSWQIQSELDITARGSGGFGHTGL